MGLPEEKSRTAAGSDEIEVVDIGREIIDVDGGVGDNSCCS